MTIALYQNGRLNHGRCLRWVGVHQKLLNLDSWDIYLVLNNSWPDQLNSQADACVDMDRDHQVATIYVRPGVYPTDVQLKSVLLHELLHVRLCTIPQEETDHAAMLIEHAVAGINNLYQILLEKI